MQEAGRNEVSWWGGRAEHTSPNIIGCLPKRILKLD